MTQIDNLDNENIHPDDVYYNSVQSAKYVRTDQGLHLFDFGHEKLASVEVEEFTKLPTESIDLLVERPVGQYWVASYIKNEQLKIWANIDALVKSGQPVEGQILSKNKGGLSVDIGLRAFLPMSQIDIHRVENVDAFIGKTAMFKITAFDHERGNIVVSRRALLEVERAEGKEELISNLKAGNTYTGIVRNLTKYGAFVDIGGVEGLLHVSNMSWGRVDHPSELVKPGDEIQVLLLDVDKEKMKLSLGRKQLLADPWESLGESVKVGDIIEGPIVSIAPFGVFVSIKEGLEGLVHISEIAWLEKIKHPKDVVKLNENVRVKVMGIDLEERRISLSIKQLAENPYVKLSKEKPRGTKITGKISGVSEFGLFVQIAPFIDGLVHQSDISWKQIDDFAEKFKVGEEQEVLILDVDVEAGRVSLGIKQLSDDPWQSVEGIAKVGSKIDVTIVRIADFGAFAEVMPGIEGLIHVSELSEERVDSPASVVKVGQRVNVLVTAFDRTNERIGLSLKRDELEVKEDSSYSDLDGSASTLGDLLRDRLGDSEE